jgi:hypothetical protein
MCIVRVLEGIKIQNQGIRFELAGVYLLTTRSRRGENLINEY